MTRWVRIVLWGGLVLAIGGLGAIAGLFLFANKDWVSIAVPSWFTGFTEHRVIEVWLPGLLAGWLVAAVSILLLLTWSLYYVWKTRQSESLIAGLESEMTKLRNLPLVAPTPFEDVHQREE